ncbi:uncharacterized protein LOC131892253 isoform X2 [Tigriopus californicus]|uniref:uncharacterized protein LOC131892253 isoform X2 n=1 Tax=Tigriopus californicus TaxID=6832 RepID=UPI0027DA0F18|nr:uncharacterized protein LOC131892253 isoform X2 [Tigriopus californicus]
MGPFMVEIVFCPVTRRGRKKRKGQNKNAITDSRNEGPAFRFIPQEDTLKVTLDLSEDGPVFSALDEMMMKMLDEDSEDRAKRSKETAAEAKTALKNLLKSGIPGIETMFAGPSADASGRKKTAGKLSGRQKGFHKMTEGSRTKFMKAVFGKEGTSIDTTTAAALLAATYSGGDPQIGENIAQLLVPEMGAKVDQNMMAALMSSSSMINAGATIEEVMRCMKDELSKSDLTEDEILHKTKTIMKAFGKEDKSSSMLDFSLVSKQSNSALKQAQISPKEFAKLVLCQRILAHCGVTAENLAKMMMVQSQLVRRGAQARHVAEVLVSVVGDGMSKAKQVSDFQNPCQDEKLKKNDVLNSVRITEALDNENEPSWKEVKQMKDILSGASTSSAESIGLNLQRALKAAQLSKMDIANTIQAQKAISALDPNSELVAKLMLIEKNIAQNGVPPVEIARVLGDGVRSREVFDLLAETALSAIDNDFKANDVELMVKVYEQLGLKGNIPTEVIEHIDRNLIQVRCSLEDVAENHVSSALSRGERETMIARSLTEVLMKTGASLEIVVSTMYTVLKRKMENIDDLEMIKIIGRSLIDAAVESDDFLPALKSLQVDNMELIEEDLMKRGMEILLKELQFFPDEIRQKIDVVYPPPPPVEKVQAEKDELDLLTADEIFARFAKSKGGPSDSLDSSRRGSFAGKGAKNPTISVEGEEPMDENMAKMLLQRQMSSSSSRRGSFMSTETTKRSSVAYVVDKTADQRLSGMVEDVTDGDEANGALNPASLKRLQALDPTNPANADLTATCNLAKEELSKGGFVNEAGVLCTESGQPIRGPSGSPVTMESMSHFGAQGVSKSVMENLSKTASQLSPKALTEAAIAQGANADQVAQLLAQTNCSPQEAQALQAKAILAGLESSKLTPQGNMSPQKLQKLSQSTKTLPPEVAAQVALKEGASLEQALQLAQAQGASEAELTKIKTQIVNQGQVLADNLGSDGGNGLTQDDLDVIAAATNSMPLEMAMEEALSQGASIEQALQLAQANGASIKQLSQIRSKLSAQTGVAKSSAIMDSITAALESGTDPAQILETARANGASTSELSQIRAATILSQGGNLQDVIEEAKAQGATAEDLAKIVASVTSEDIGFPIQDKSHQGKVSGASVTQVAQNLTNAQGPQGPSIQDMILTAKSNGASPQQIAQMVAQSNGPEYKSPEDVALLAKVIGLNPKEASLMQASISISQGGDILSVIQKAKANGASAGEIAQLASMAAGQEGADVKAILQAAAAEGVPPSGLSQIKSIASVSQGANLRDVLKAAKAQGANQEYIAQITAAAAASQNLSASELLAMAKEVGMNDSDLDVIVQSVPPDLFQTQISKAVSALDQGANPDQILSAARDSGMPDCEILKLEAKLAITQGKSVLEVLSKAKANGASTVELKQIEAMVKSTTDPNQMMEAVTAGVLSTSELVAALRKSDHANQETLLKTAIQFGLSDTDLSQLATAAGVSRSELQQMKSLVNETTGLTPKQLAMVSADEKNSTPQQIAAAAMKSGANVNQALELAKAQGATKQELEEIRTQMSSLVAPSRAPINPGLSKETLAQLVKSNADTSEEELAKLVIALGATPDQISDLMASQGVSQQMLNQIQSNAQAAQKVTTQLNKGVTADKLSRIQRRLHGSSPADLVEMSLIQGASPAQILELGKAQGFNASQLKELQSVIQKTVQEIIDNGGNITVLGLGGQQSANAERGNKYEVKDYGYLFDTSLNMGSDVDLDTIRYRVAKHVAGTSNSGKGFVTSTNVTASIPIPNQEEPHFGGIGSYEGEKRPQLKPTVIEQDEIPRQRKTYNDSKSDIKVERDQRVDRSMDDVESRSGTRIRQSNQDSKTESKQESNVTKSPKVDQIQIAKESNGQVKVAKPKKETYNPTPQRRSEKDASPIKRARDQLQPFTSKRPPAEKPVASKARESRFQCEEEPSSTIQSRRKLTNYDDGLASIRYRTTEPIQSDAPSYKSSYIPTQYSGLDKSLAARKRSRFQPFNDGENKGMSEDDVNQLMQVFKQEGILISKDGVTKFRTADDMNETMDDTAFQKALTEFNSRDQSEISAESQRLLSKMFQTQTDNIAAIRERLKVVQDQGMSSIHSRSYDLSSVVDYTAYGSGKSTYVPMQSSARDFSSPEPQVVQRGPRQRRIVPPTDSSDYRPKSWRDMIDLPEYRSTRNQTPYDIGVPRLPRTRTPTPVRTLSNGDPYSSKTNYTPTYVPRNYRNSSPGAAARSAATPGVASADMRPSRDALPKGYNKRPYWCLFESASRSLTRFLNIPEDDLVRYRKLLPYTGTLSNSSILRSGVRRRFLLKRDREEERRDREERTRLAKSMERDLARNYQSPVMVCTSGGCTRVFRVNRDESGEESGRTSRASNYY